MSPRPVVSNSSPLIALAQIDGLELLHRLFDRVCVPPAVVAETSPSLAYFGQIQLGDEPVNLMAFAGQTVRIVIEASDASTASLGLEQAIRMLTEER